MCGFLFQLKNKRKNAYADYYLAIYYLFACFILKIKKVRHPIALEPALSIYHQLYLLRGYKIPGKISVLVK